MWGDRRPRLSRQEAIDRILMGEVNGMALEGNGTGQRCFFARNCPAYLVEPHRSASIIAFQVLSGEIPHSR